jgi:TonB family protein
MDEVLEIIPEEIDASPVELRLMIEPEPRFTSLLQNLRDLFRIEPEVVSYPGSSGVFWPDVFIRRELPWRRFLESGLCHIFAVVLILSLSRFITSQPQIGSRPAFDHADVIYYASSEYLPPIDTRRDAPAAPQKPAPEIAKQAIISLPPEASNHSQTIVTPPKIRLQHEVPLPNIVAWSHKPEMPIAPAPVIAASQITRLTPRMQEAVITPPPVQTERDLRSQKALAAPEPAVIAPAPELSPDANRRFGDINIAPSAVIAPAPQLPIGAQRTAEIRRPSAAQGSPQVIAPPPSVSASRGSSSDRDIIALSLHPAVEAPPSAVAGNRRGVFAATPEGHAGASGNPGSNVTTPSAKGSGAGNGKAGDLAPGLYVGKSSNPGSAIVNPRLLANARPPHIERTDPSAEANISEAERAVFGARKIYSLSLNMPNLNSGGGSWIIRFAALKIDNDDARPYSNDPNADLSSPVAVRKVDPAYPLELMRQNVAGTVILYGIIRADGTVSDVRVLRSVDDRLDRFASEAISKWQFQPATRNGSAVDVEATFWIPFRPVRTQTGF